MERRSRHHVAGATAASISANNMLANRDQLSPAPTLRVGVNNDSVHDRLANNIGLLRTMFKENAQRPLCPFIDDIGPAIVKAFNLTKQDQVAQVYELLVLSQRASGHAVAEFDVFSKLLREHSRKRETDQKKAKVREQQENALKGMKSSTGMNSARTGPTASGATAGGNTANTNTKTANTTTTTTTSNSKAAVSATTARTQQDWIAYLSQYSSKADARLNWIEFAGAIQNLPATWRRGGTLEPHDLWSGRSFFMSCASVENLPVAGESRVSAKSLSSYFVAGKMIARTAKTVSNGSTIREAMSWGDASGLAPETAFIGAAALQEKKVDTNGQQSARNNNNNGNTNNSNGQEHNTGKALRLRNGSSKKWIVAHVPVEANNNIKDINNGSSTNNNNNNNANSSSTLKLPKIKNSK